MTAAAHGSFGSTRGAATAGAVRLLCPPVASVSARRSRLLLRVLSVALQRGRVVAADFAAAAPAEPHFTGLPARRGGGECGGVWCAREEGGLFVRVANSTPWLIGRGGAAVVDGAAAAFHYRAPLAEQLCTPTHSLCRTGAPNPHLCTPAPRH